MSAADKQRPRVLVLASTYPRGPDDHEPRFVHELNKRLSLAYEVHAVVPDAAESFPGEMDGIHVHRYRYAPKPLQTLVHGGGIAANLKNAPWKWFLLPGFLLCQLFAAWQVVRRHRIEAVHAHWLIPQGLVAWALQRVTGVPYLVTSHGGDLFGLKGSVARRLKRLVARGASAVTVVSGAMLEECERIGIPSNRIHVVPMGTDLSGRFAPGAMTARVPGRILFVGRLVPKKGLTYLLKAMPEVHQRMPAVHLHIVGFGPEEGALRAEAFALGVADIVHFIGPLKQEQLPATYATASLFVAPFVRDQSGDQEGLPVALLEAIGCGCPVLAGDVPGLVDLLGPFSEQVTVNPRDSSRLASRIVECLGKVDEVAAWSSAIRERVVDRLDWQRIGERYSTLLRRVMDQAAAPAE